MNMRNAAILNHKKTTIVVVGFLITALASKNIAQNPIEAFSDPIYHHVHHDGSDLKEHGVDETSVPHHHNKNSNTAEHKHCHTHGSQIIDSTIFISDLHFAYCDVIVQNIKNYFKHDELIHSTLATSIFRPPIFA